MHLSGILTVADLPDHELPVDRVDWVIRGLEERNTVPRWFSFHVWLPATRYWLSNRTANASYMTKWASGNCLPAHKVWEQRIHFWGGLQMFAVSLKVCLRVLTMVCSLEAQYSHTSYLIRKIHTSLRQTRTKCFIFPILEMASETYQSPLEDQWSISDFDSD